MKRNLLLAGYTGYKTVDKVQDFVESFNSVRRPQDDLCIVYDEASDINHFLDQYTWVTQVRKIRVSENAYADRFSWFADLIEQSELHHRFVCADIRDVHFQCNPFEWMENNLKKDVVASDEGLAHDVKGGDFTWKQIKDGFPEFVESIRKKTVLNVGVMGGDRRVGKICRKVFEMCQSVEPKIHSYNSYAFDQGAFNILCYLTEQRAFTHTSGPEEDWCITMSTSPAVLPETPLIDNHLCTPSGKPYAIVHQADRHNAFLRYKGSGRFEAFKGDNTFSTTILQGKGF